MKYFKTFKFLLAAIAGVVLVLWYSSCKKMDDTYKNYQTTAGNFSGNAYEYLQSQSGIYDSMLLAVNRVPGLADTLKTRPVTLFAVSNRSFSVALQNINQARADSVPQMPPVYIRTMDLPTLDTFLCRYIVRGKILSSDLLSSADGYFVPTVKYDYNMQMQHNYTNASGFLKGGPQQIIFSYPPPKDSVNHIFVRYWVRTYTNTVNIQSSNAIINLLSTSHDFGFGNNFIRAINKR